MSAPTFRVSQATLPEAQRHRSRVSRRLDEEVDIHGIDSDVQKDEYEMKRRSNQHE